MICQTYTVHNIHNISQLIIMWQYLCRTTVPMTIVHVVCLCIIMEPGSCHAWLPFEHAQFFRAVPAAIDRLTLIVIDLDRWHHERDMENGKNYVTHVSYPCSQQLNCCHLLIDPGKKKTVCNWMKVSSHLWELAGRRVHGKLEKKSRKKSKQ